MGTSVLNFAANVALASACGFLGLVSWQRYTHPPNPPTANLSRPFRAGEKAPAIPDVEYASSERSVVLFLSTTCHYCESSIPFYNKLARLTQESHGKWKVLTLFAESKERVEEFRARLHLTAEALPGTEFRRFGVRSTPTAILVDRNGIIDRAWFGASDAVDADILAALRVSP